MLCLFGKDGFNMLLNWRCCFLLWFFSLTCFDNWIKNEALGWFLVSDAVQCGQQQVVVLESKESSASVDIDSEKVDSRFRIYFLIFEGNGSKLIQELFIKASVID